MSEILIPDENLPVYLKKYKVYIYPEKEETQAGAIEYTTVEAVPSDIDGARVWALNLTGVLAPNVEKYRIVYDFSGVDYYDKQGVTFNKIISGTFNICDRVLNASKIIGYNYTYSREDFKLTIELDTSKWNFRLKKKAVFSYQLNINDCSPPCESSEITTPPNYEIPQTYWPLENNDHVTLGGYTDSGGNPIALTVYNNNGTLDFGTPQNPNSQYYWFQCNNDWRYVKNPKVKSGDLNGSSCNNSVTIENNGAWCIGSETFYIFAKLTGSNVLNVYKKNCAGDA